MQAEQKSSFQKLSDEKLVSVIRFPYFDHMKWDDVAYEMDCSRKTIQLLHNIALDAIADILAAEQTAQNKGINYFRKLVKTCYSKRYWKSNGRKKKLTKLDLEILYTHIASSLNF